MQRYIKERIIQLFNINSNNKKNIITKSFLILSKVLFLLIINRFKFIRLWNSKIFSEYLVGIYKK